MHLMTFIEIAKLSLLERILIIAIQFLFSAIFLLLYLISSRTAHRLVGYFEEEAIISYNLYLKEIDKGNIENISAPRVAIEYWKLEPNASLRDVILKVIEDETTHRDNNHNFADILENNT